MMTSRRATLLAALPLLAGLAGCDTLDHIQQAPLMSSPGELGSIPPTAYASPVMSAARLPDTSFTPGMQGSLWRAGAKTFFRDPRARAVGDLLTVAVSLQESGAFNNQTQLQRDTANSFSVPNLFGVGTLIGRMIPGLRNTNPTIATTGSEKTNGNGQIARSETLLVNVAATVLSVLPNNNFEIAGSQEVRLDNELRVLQIRGVIRPEDIRSDNTIASDKVAEARISYGGRGVSSDLQRPRWGQDVLNRLQPF